MIEYAPGKCLPKGGHYLRRGVFHVRIERPIPFEEYSKIGEDKDIAAWFRHYYEEKYSEIADEQDRLCR